MKTRPLTDLLWLFVGPVVWFAQFAVLYGAEALICTPPQATGRLMTWIGAAATLVALIAFAAMLLRIRPVTDDAASAFLHGSALVLALLSALAVLWTAFPLAILPVCSPAG